MKFSSHLIYFIVLFAQLFVKESNETNANRKYKCRHQSNDRAEFDFKPDDAVTSQYKTYLNAPTKLGPDQFTNTLQEWFDKFQIDAAIWHFQKLSSELLGEALRILNESNDVEQISGEETPTNAKEAVVGKTKTVFVHKMLEMATEYARIETKCAKMKEGIEDLKRALCYHYNTLATIVEGMDKWTTDKRATSKILGKRRVKKLIKILPVHSTEAKVPVESLCNSENDLDRIFSELITSDQKKTNMLHAENVARMVRTSALFRDFLCSEPELSKIKLKLEELVGNVELMRLEEEFPEILRIDFVTQQTMLESYKQLLSSKFPIDKRNKMFLRKTMAMMIGKLREMEIHFKKLHSKNGTLQKIVVEKLQIILNNSFDNLHSLNNICVMIKFVYFVHGKRTAKQLETELKLWKTKKCEMAEEQQRTLDDYYGKELGKQYTKEIVDLLKSDKNPQILQLLEEIGAKSQLIKFIGPKMFEKLDASGLLHKIFPSNSFQNDENLWECYATTITNDKLSDLGMKSKLVADFIVFFRFLHQTLSVEQKMEIFWDRINKFFDIKFDALLANDSKLEVILNFQGNLDIIFLKTKKFVTDEIVGENWKKPSKHTQALLWNKWEQKIYKSSEKKATNLRRIFNLDEFLSKLHQKEMAALFRHKYFFDKFQGVLSEYGLEKIKYIVNPSELGEDWEKMVEKEEKQFPNITKSQNLLKKLEKTHSEKQEELKSECKNIVKPSFEQEMLDKITDDQMGKIEQFGCPDKGLTLQEMVAFEKTNFSVDEHLLMVSFMEYFTTDAADVQLNRRLKEQKQCLQVELDTLLWIYSNFLQILKIDYINKEMNSQNRKVEICKIYQSFQFVVIKQTLLSDDNSLLTFLHSFLYEEFSDKEEIRSVRAEDFASWLAPRCGDDEKVQRVLARLCSNRSKLEEINFITFRNLLEKSLQFRAYFCNLSEKTTILVGKKSEKESNSNKNGWSPDEFGSEISATKGKLYELVGDDSLIKLEEQFPEVLKIGVQLLKAIPALYKNIFSHKSHTSKAKMWASRLAIPQIVQQIDTFLIGEIKNSATVCVELQNVLNVKCKQIYRNAFETLARREFFEWTGQSLCLLVQFEKLAKSTLALCSTAAKDRINLETVRNWWPNCTEYDAQLNAYQQHQKMNVKEHTSLLFLIIKENAEFREFVRETPGVRRRIDNLLASEGNYSKLMAHCAEYPRKPATETEDGIELLYSKFLDTFDTLDVESKLAHVLALSYAVWTRWMDVELRVENPRLPIGLRQIYEQIWRHRRERYGAENVYDKIYDESLEELMFRKKLIREVFTKVKNFVESKRNEKNLEKLGLKTWKAKSNNRHMQTQNVNSGKLLEEWETIWAMASLRIQMEEAECQRNECQRNECQRNECQKNECQRNECQRNECQRNECQKNECQRNECQTKMERFEVEPSDWMQTQHFNMLTDLLEHKSMRVRLKNELKARPEIVEQWLLQFMCWEMAEKILYLIKLNDEQFAVMRAYLKENRTKRGENSEEKEQKQEEKERIGEQLIEEKRMGMKEKEENGGQKKSPKEEKLMRKRKHSKKSFLDTKKSEKGKKTVKNFEQIATTTTTQFEMSDSAAVGGGTENSASSSLESSNFSEKFEQNSPNQKTTVNKNDDDLKKALENVDLNDFFKGDYLMSKYQNILLDPNKLASQILGIGIYLYEIWNRFKAADGMLKAISEFETNEMQLIYSNQLDNIMQKWNKFRQHLVDITKFGNFNHKVLEKSLHIMLKEIISVAEGWNIETKTCSISQNDEEKEIKNVKMQLHRNNLANSITSKFCKCADIWAKSSDERRMRLLLSLYQWDKKKKQNSKMVHKFLTDLNGWQKMLEQQQIDRFSTIQHNNYLLNSKFGTEKVGHTHYSSFMFPQFNQQLFFVQFDDDEKHLTELNEIVIKKNDVKTDEANKALNELKIIMLKWSKDARMLETGSFMLGARTSNSDIDIICIVPQKLTKFEERNQFFGTFECNLTLRKCEQNSFYCLLCQHDNVEMLQKLPLAFIPLIKLKFCGIEFDILFVSIPTIETLPSEPMTRSDVIGLMHKLAIQAEPDEKMIKSLAGYITNDHIMELLGNKIIQKFRKFIAILKLWAKSNYLYNSLFGFFNGISLTIMATKVLLFYPNASVPFLLHKFFFIYCTWEWPIPVRLAVYVPNEFEKFSWTQKAEEDKKNSPLLMPIITPGCLEQNGMYNMSKSTYQIVQTSMQEALVKVRQIPSSSDWRQLFPMKKFTEKYEHFVAICCIVGNHIHLDKFCGFVGRRIRLQLEHFDDMTSEIKFSHILTENDGKLKCPNSILTHSKSQFKNLSLHKVWLVGIELADKAQNVNSNEAKAHLKSKINTKLSEEFDNKILNGFLKGCYQPILLISNYVDTSELELDDSFV